MPAGLSLFSRSVPRAPCEQGEAGRSCDRLKEKQLCALCVSVVKIKISEHSPALTCSHGGRGPRFEIKKEGIADRLNL